MDAQDLKSQIAHEFGFENPKLLPLGYTYRDVPGHGTVYMMCKHERFPGGFFVEEDGRFVETSWRPPYTTY